MVVKVFRLYQEGKQTTIGWSEETSFVYNEHTRNTIEDPDGASSKTEITSIPSPFARIDLVKQAFRMVTGQGGNRRAEGLDGRTIFHKMVSDTLDIGEIFFNIQKYKDDFEIIPCDVEALLRELEGSPVDGHRYMGDALRKYKISDSQLYNFEKLKTMYVLNYKHGPAEMNIVGATSPSTMFFSTANDLSYLSHKIFFANDRPFDEEFCPLYRRDFEYIKFWFYLRKSIPQFADVCKELDRYLSETYKAISDPEQQKALAAIKPNDPMEFAPIEVKGEKGLDRVEVLGCELLCRSSALRAPKSDFTIDVNHTRRGAITVLVLPIEAGNTYEGFEFVNGIPWENGFAAPIYDEAPLEERRLPQNGSIFPYVTLGDFLEDSLIRVPHRLNSKYYFDGNIQGLDPDARESYLLPIKPRYFEFFGIESLKGTIAGKPVLEMRTLAGKAVSVTLRVAIKGTEKIRYIQYERTYYPDRPATLKENKGRIVTFRMTAFLTPGIQFANPKEAIYTVGCIMPLAPGKPSDDLLSFSFYNQDNSAIHHNRYSRNDRAHDKERKPVTYTVKGDNISAIRVSDREGRHAGVIFPMLDAQSSNKDFSVAVDLGSSNTHIEIKQEGTPGSEDLHYDEKRPMLSQVFLPSYIRDKNRLVQDDLLVESEFITNNFYPEVLAKGTDFSLPTRTVLAKAIDIDWTQSLDPLGMTNMAFSYGRRVNKAYDEILSNIKWENKDPENHALRAYVNNILLTIRNYLLVRNANLANTKLVWFYPISMTKGRVKQLERIWNDGFQDMFNETGATQCVTESVAPVEYFCKVKSNANNLVNIDIGGGTVDIAFANNKEVNLVSSMRFGANVLFDATYAKESAENGIVDFLRPYVELILSKCNDEEKASFMKLQQIYRDDKSMKDPTNAISFMFSLLNNSALGNINVRYKDFNRRLQEDSDFKIVFILYYTAIIYYVAQILKLKEKELPRHISFSGNGSKVIDIITTDKKLLAKYTQLIIEKITGRKYNSNNPLEIPHYPDIEPKDITCKGGLLFSETPDNDAIESIVLKAEGEEAYEPGITYGDLDETTLKEETLRSAEAFFTFFFNDLMASFDLNDNFVVSQESIDLARQASLQDLETFAQNGMREQKEEGENTIIEESPFFYCLKGILYALSLNVKKEIKDADK